MDFDVERRLAADIAEIVRVTKAKGPQIVEELLEIAVDIDRRERAVRPVKNFNSMPAVTHNTEERRGALAQRLLEIDAGDDPVAVFGCRNLPTSAELDLLASIDTTFRTALRKHAETLRDANTETRDPDIDYKILWRAAAGESQRAIAKEFKISQQRVAYLRRTRLAAIWRAISHLAPPQTRRRPGPAATSPGASPERFIYFSPEYRYFRSAASRD